MSEKKLHVLNGSEKVGFIQQPFELKLIIVVMWFEVQIIYGNLGIKTLDIFFFL